MNASAQIHVLAAWTTFSYSTPALQVIEQLVPNTTVCGADILFPAFEMFA
jgi:hypothetical protein